MRQGGDQIEFRYQANAFGNLALSGMRQVHEGTAKRIAPHVTGYESGGIRAAIPSYGLLGRDGREFEHSAVLCRFGNLTFAQRLPYGVEFLCIFD